MSRLRPRLPSLPIWAQILSLLLGGLIAAQMVTLALTLLLPPAPPQQHSLDEIADALRGRFDPSDDRPLIRSIEVAPPSLQSPGWVVSQGSTDELVKLLGAPASEVRLLFYAPPPLAGTAPSPRELPPSAQAQPRQLRLASLMLLSQAGPPRAPVGAIGPAGDSGRGFTAYGERRRGPGSRSAPAGAAGPAGPDGVAGRGAGSRSPPFGGFPQGPPSGRRSATGQAAPIPAVGRPLRADPPLALPPRLVPRDPLDAAAFDPSRIGVYAPAPRPVPPPAPAGVSEPPHLAPIVALAPPPSIAAPVVQSPARPALAAIVRAAPALTRNAAPPAPPPVAVPPERALPAPQRPSVFGLARASYVEGEFVAALHNADGRWSTVRPQPEGFPNSWQRRVVLWFCLAFAVIAPLGYLFARRLAAPLNDFAAAAERLGREPSADLAPLTGPAEVGRAASAFNLMQRRLKRYVEDRTGMIGAISHDLRTPLARMRFKLEAAPASVRAALDRDIRQMEEMIDSVLGFMRDEAAVTGRQRVDLRSLLECVVDEADGAADLAAGAPVEVEIDVLGLQRVFENLIGNAVKYGGHARVRLSAESDEAKVEVADDGPGLADDELEQVFKPFFRGEAARASGRAGVGLGLAVSRSTVRAHGGDLVLRRGEQGLVAEVRLPLSRRAAMAA